MTVTQARNLAIFLHRFIANATVKSGGGANIGLNMRLFVNGGSPRIRLKKCNAQIVRRLARKISTFVPAKVALYFETYYDNCHSKHLTTYVSGEVIGKGEKIVCFVGENHETV